MIRTIRSKLIESSDGNLSQWAVEETAKFRWIFTVACLFCQFLSSLQISFSDSPDPGQRVITRPYYVTANEWRHLAKSVNTTADMPYEYDKKLLHCRYHLMAARGYHKYDNVISSYLQRMDIVEHIQRANQQRGKFNLCYIGSVVIGLNLS